MKRSASASQWSAPLTPSAPACRAVADDPDAVLATTAGVDRVDD
jgi:hypothetical protein